MIRFRLPLGRTLFFVSAFLFALVALLPLRLAADWLALDERGLAAREAQGSVWLGMLAEAQFGPASLGDVQSRLRTLPLLIGRGRIDLVRHEQEDRFKGAITVTRNGFGIDDLTSRLEPGTSFLPVPLSTLETDDLDARFGNGVCVDATGLVRASLGDVGGASLPALTGTARCDGGALLLLLASQSGMEVLNLRLFGDGRYRAELIVRPGDTARASSLTGSGWIPTPQGLALRSEGEL